MSDEGAHWYMHLNQRLLRIQRIGSPFGNVLFTGGTPGDSAAPW